jgi:hypothetical protein
MNRGRIGIVTRRRQRVSGERGSRRGYKDSGNRHAKLEGFVAGSRFRPPIRAIHRKAVTSSRIRLMCHCRGAAPGGTLIRSHAERLSLHPTGNPGAGYVI